MNLYNTISVIVHCLCPIKIAAGWPKKNLTLRGIRKKSRIYAISPNAKFGRMHTLYVCSIIRLEYQIMLSDGTAQYNQSMFFWASLDILSSKLWVPCQTFLDFAGHFMCIEKGNLCRTSFRQSNWKKKQMGPCSMFALFDKIKALLKCETWFLCQTFCSISSCHCPAIIYHFAGHLNFLPDMSGESNRFHVLW